jgi:hypothetical protein
VSTATGRARLRRGGYASRAAAEQARQAFLALPNPVAAGRTWTMQRGLELIHEQVRPSTLRGYREHVDNSRSSVSASTWATCSG